ncbi:MAG: SDR family NAD(P)-dependent oxidoreductase [Alphaproteobacteria bacterium]|nr:SDR family NAD(P)-dependent oxidoreductase [Alphaproteobacteria bacterium]
MQGLDGKVILVTGATGNLGGAVAKGALVAGAKLALAGRSMESLERSFVDGNQVALIPDVDLTDAHSTQRYIKRAISRFGRIDGLISTVGGFAFANIADDSYETWDRMIAINIRSAFQVCQSVLPVMRQQGSGAIVLTGATAALKAPGGLSAYAASKSAVMRLTESLSDEAKRDGLTVNCVMPGIIDTPQNRSDMPDADRTGWVSPEAIADVMLFLVSDAARAVTGALIPVTGKN